MTRFRARIVRLAAALSVGIAAATTAMGEAPGEMRLKMTKIMDPTGFEKPMAAAYTVIPADWMTKGGVIWRTTGDCQIGATPDWSATSPDGKAEISMPPANGWRFNNMGMPVPKDCIPAAFSTADEYVGALISQLQWARIVDVERDETLMKILSQPPFYSEMPGDPYTRNWWDAAAVTFTYVQEGEDYTATMIVFTMHIYMLSGHSYGMGTPLETGYGGSMVQILLSAPSNRFNEYVPAFLMFLKNYQAGPEWQAHMDKHNAAISQQALASSRNISKIMSGSNSDISDMSMESWRRRNEISDRSQRETSEWIRDVETYSADTPTGQIELPSGFDRAFQLNDDTFVVTNDTFVVTNDAFYEPFRDSGIDGRELSAAP